MFIWSILCYSCSFFLLFATGKRVYCFHSAFISIHFIWECNEIPLEGEYFLCVRLFSRNRWHHFEYAYIRLARIWSIVMQKKNRKRANDGKWIKMSGITHQMCNFGVLLCNYLEKFTYEWSEMSCLLLIASHPPNFYAYLNNLSLSSLSSSLGRRRMVIEIGAA